MNNNSTLKAIVLAFLLIFSLNSQLLAQTNFIPFEDDDILIKEEKIAFTPGLSIGAEFWAMYNIMNSGSTFKWPTSDGSVNETYRDYNEAYFDYDVKLNFKTVLHRNIEINLNIETRSLTSKGTDLRNEPQKNKQLSNESQTTSLYASEAYLDYHPNPNSTIRIGKHYVNLGDGKGLTYAGTLDGISAICKAGTWCVDLGVYTMSRSEADMLYHFGFGYPAFYEETADGKIDHQLLVKVYQIYYSEKNIPLGKNLGPSFYSNPISSDTGPSGTETATDVADAAAIRAKFLIEDDNNKALAFDVNQFSYFGFDVKWQSGNFEVSGGWYSGQGKRRYHLYKTAGSYLTQPKINGTAGDTSLFPDTFNSRNKSIVGSVGNIELSYKYDLYKIELVYLNASGDQHNLDTSGGNYLRPLSGYFEIAHGSYNGTRLYFNGAGNSPDSGGGLGHSVNNTILGGAKFSVKVPVYDMVYTIGAYSLDRNKAVLNENNKLVKKIGNELDNRFTFIVDKHMVVDTEFNIFVPQGSFSYFSNSVPLAKQETVVQAVTRISYSF